VNEPTRTAFTLPIPVGDFKAYLFDLDGTVADTMSLHFVAWTRAVTEAGGTFPEELFFAWAGIPLVRTVELLNERFGHSMNPADVVRRKEALYLGMLDRVQPVAAVVEHVHAQHGAIPMAIVSGSPRDSIVRTLTTLGLLAYFDTLVGSEDYAHGKPDPEPFVTAAKRLGVAPRDCLVFEDADAGIQSAQAAGMQWVRVPVQSHAAAK
jgi:HAD superfamily hydrolase (TIGR01509 family)